MKRLWLAAFLFAASSVAGFCASYDDLNAGILFRNQDDWKNAIAQFDKAIAAGDLPPSQKFIAYLDRAQAHLILDQFDQAISDYSSSMALRASDPEALVGRAAAYDSVGKYDDAAADLDMLVARRPKLLLAYRMRAVVNLKRGQRDKSVDDYKTILAQVPEAGRGNLPAGIIAWLAEDYAQAEESFSHAASQGNGDIYAWLWYTLTELHLGKSVPHRDVPDFDKKKWPASLVSLYLGETTPDALLAATGDPDAPARRGCELDLFAGEWLLQHHDASAAKPLVKKATQDCASGSMEHSVAEMDLGASS